MNDLHLIDGFYACADRYLWHPESATAVLSDLHLGVEHALAAGGMPIPPVHLGPVHNAWDRIAERLRSSVGESHIVIAGDLFDSPHLPAETMAEALALFDKMPAHTTITIIPGNHDPSAETLASFLNAPRVRIAPQATVADYLIIHGHQAPPTAPAPRGFIVGHQHPAVVLRNAVQSAKMICFAACTMPTRKKNTPLLILPTFSPMPLGSNLMTDRHWILALPRPAAANIRIAGIVRDQVLDFGTLDQL